MRVANVVGDSERLLAPSAEALVDPLMTPETTMNAQTNLFMFTDMSPSDLGMLY